MYNDQLKATVEANQLAISALKLQLETVAVDVEKTDTELQARFNAHISAYNTQHPVIPNRIKSTLKAFITDSLIRLRWNDYDKPERTNSMDIYHYDNKHYDQLESGNHRWEICTSSARLVINTTDEMKAKYGLENIDIAKLGIGIYELIHNTTEQLIGFHKKYSENRNREYELQYAIQKLERAIQDAEKHMANNTTIRIFKPGGETAVCIFNKDIVFPEIGVYGNRRTGSRRRSSTGIYFDAVRLIKETKKGIRVEFVRYAPATETREAQTWVSGTKWLTLHELVTLYQVIDEGHKLKIKREAEREANRIAEELKNQTN